MGTILMEFSAYYVLAHVTPVLQLQFVFPASQGSIYWGQVATPLALVG